MARQVGGPPAFLTGGVEDLRPLAAELIDERDTPILQELVDPLRGGKTPAAEIGHHRGDGGAIINLAEALLNAAQRGEARAKTGTVARTKQLQRIPQAFGQEPLSVKLGQRRMVAERLATLREVGRRQGRELAARILRRSLLFTPFDGLWLGHTLDLETGPPLAGKAAILPRTDLPREAAGCFAPLVTQASDHHYLRRHAGFSQKIERHIQIAHATGELHQTFELAADSLAGMAGIKLREYAQADIEATDGDAEIVDGVGVQGLGGLADLVRETAEKDRRLQAGVLAHGGMTHSQSRALETETGRL